MNINKIYELANNSIDYVDFQNKVLKHMGKRPGNDERHHLVLNAKLIIRKTKTEWSRVWDDKITFPNKTAKDKLAHPFKDIRMLRKVKEKFMSVLYQEFK